MASGTVQYDSRRVRPGDVFVAMRGGTTDGNRYIEQALARGAASIVTDSVDRFGQLNGKVDVRLVENGRRALAEMAAEALGHPERRLKVSAVTGTNGKTTTAYLLEQMLRSVKRTCVLLGTIETHVGQEVRVSEHTTPEASDVLQVFADAVAVGATEAVMEMSSHALEQERVWGIPVDVAVFTNLTQDHLDYHGTMEAYAAAKARMFEGVGAGAPRVAVVNVEDEFGRVIAGRAAGVGSEVMRYGVGGEYRAERVVASAGGTAFEFVTPAGKLAVRSPLVGRVNVLNGLAASCAGLARGMRLEEIGSAVAGLRQVPGRFQVVPDGGTGITVVVDYAHTDDALKNLIALGREMTAGKVITVFGCGGDRDRGKRAKMGRVAALGSDLVVVTSDNPRSESPLAIIDQILVGMDGSSTVCLVEEERAGAIEIAIRAAGRGDIVLIAGKGHEKVQVFADGAVAFDDVVVATQVLAELA